MTKKAKPAVMWAITIPGRPGKGRIIVGALETRRNAIEFWGPLGRQDWKYWRSKGVRCVKVRVTEI